MLTLTVVVVLAVLLVFVGLVWLFVRLSRTPPDVRQSGGGKSDRRPPP